MVSLSIYLAFCVICDNFVSTHQIWIISYNNGFTSLKMCDNSYVLKGL